MVFPYSKRVPPKSFVRSRFTKTRGFREPRSARTPPSTFLFLHLHLSNSPGPESPTPVAGRSAKPRFDGKSQPTGIGCYFTHQNEEHHGRENMPWPVGQCSAALSGRVIGSPERRCQRSRQEIVASLGEFLRRKEAAIFAKHAPHLSHIPATF
jgi:hypothetical protein